MQRVTKSITMCGIAGYFNIRAQVSPEYGKLECMIHQLHHRGPDGYGFYGDEQVGLAHARLSIIDLEGGWQPIHNEDKTLWVIFNGEIFNYPELKEKLEARGHRFRSNSDTEVIVHQYEEKGEACLADFNGQFALVVYDRKRGSLFIARDRFGIRPLYYCYHGDRFYFASEIKAIFAADPAIPRSLNPGVIRDVFTFWTPVGEETAFRGVFQLEPGCCATLRPGSTLRVRQYWELPFGETTARAFPSQAACAEEFRELLIDAVHLQLRADVPVGAYLSGGLDSSAITSLVRHYTTNPLKTFSVGFSDTVYDERGEQAEVVRYLGTDHHEVLCSYEDIAEHFPTVIRHTEAPILRTAPTPLFLLSRLARQNDYKVVLTGEGADEILGGYDLFKEAKIRAFIQRMPDSSLRPLLLKRLYPYLPLSPTKSAEYARNFFDTDAPLTDIFYGHRPRWKTTSHNHLFFTDDFRAAAGHDSEARLAKKFSRRLAGLDVFSRAQWVETKLLLGNYLLSSQGDRMAMANSLEGRYPFLDHRVVEFAGTIPVAWRMRVLNEKNILKKAMTGLLPEKVLTRKKQPYMAPDILSFFGETRPDYLQHYLSDALLAEAGVFKPQAVSRLVGKCSRNARQGFRENMAFVGILSTQILYDAFVKNFRAAPTPARLENIKVMV
jgi:asparagine synthase (glutamine-hydrolysing)